MKCTVKDCPREALPKSNYCPEHKPSKWWENDSLRSMLPRKGTGRILKQREISRSWAHLKQRRHRKKVAPS